MVKKKKKKRAKRGRSMMFHGAYKKKSDAVKKEESREGAFIVSRWLRGNDHRYIVMTPRSK